MNKQEFQYLTQSRYTITCKEWDVLNKLYLLLDLDKGFFAKIVDAVGVDTLVERELYWDRLQAADDERQERIKFEKAQDEMRKLILRQVELAEYISNYKGVRRGCVK